MTGWAAYVKTRDASEAGEGWYWYEVLSVEPGGSPIEGQGEEHVHRMSLWRKRLRVEPGPLAVSGPRRLRLALVASAFASTCVSFAEAAEPAAPRFRLDAGLTFSRFEQQVKTELGGTRGHRLVEEFSFGYAHSLTYRALDWNDFSLAGGAFMQADVGRREAARFSGFAADGSPITTDRIGGSFAELWMGPLLRLEWRRVFAELGYGLYGARRDEARDDLPSEDGSVDGTLRTSASVAWSFAVGGRIPIVDTLDLVLRMQYRIRYYDARGGWALAGGAVHGTQNYTPFVGVAWSFGR